MPGESAQNASAERTIGILARRLGYYFSSLVPVVVFGQKHSGMLLC